MQHRRGPELWLGGIGRWSWCIRTGGISAKASRLTRACTQGAAILELPEPDKRLDVLVMCSLKQGGGAAGSSESPAQRVTGAQHRQRGQGRAGKGRGG